MNSVPLQIEEGFSLHGVFFAASEDVLPISKERAVFPNCKFIIQILVSSWQHIKIPHS